MEVLDLFADRAAIFLALAFGFFIVVWRMNIA
jgi:hypothetical protein